MRTGVRYAATAVACAALALMAWRPERSVIVHPRDALLVTPGAQPARVRRLADSIGTARVLSLTGADSLPDAGFIARHFGDAARLHVVGWGLPTSDWPALRVAAASLHLAPPPMGFTHAAWPRLIPLGEQLQVRGRLVGPGGTHILLSITGGGAVDSAVTGPDGSFALATQPRATGRQLYTLSATSVPAETLGVVVTPPPRWRTLIVTAAPSFEAAAVRDLLAGRGGAVTWRAGVSRERIRTEYVNRDSTVPTGLRARDFAALDLLLLDGRSFMALSAAERAAMRAAVADSGLGVLLLPDDALPAAARALGFSLLADTALTERLVRPVAAGGTPATAPVPAEPYLLRETFGARAVLWGAAGEILAQVMPLGAGAVGVTMVTAPSRWVRAGERATFATYWSALLATVVASPGRRWSIGGAEPSLANRAVEISRLTPGRRPGVSRSPFHSSDPVAIVLGPDGARDTVYLSADALEPGRWIGRYWPRRSGWHEIADEPDAAWYVTAPTTWMAHQAAERLAATARWAATAPPAGAAQAPLTARRPFPVGWYLALFVLAAGVLWAERRRAYIRAMPRTVVAVLLLGLLGCGKSEEKRREEVARCGGLSSDADVIAVCLMTEHKWKERPADSAGKREAFRIDSMRIAQEAMLWNADSERHKAALKTCAKTNDVRECLLVNHGWPADRATRAADSLWARDGQTHARQIRSCTRAQGPVASCLMLNYKWNAARAMATEDSVRRARLR